MSTSPAVRPERRDALPAARTTGSLASRPHKVTAAPRPDRAELRVSAFAYKRGDRYEGWDAVAAPRVPRAVTLGIVPRNWHGEEYNRATPVPGDASAPADAPEVTRVVKSDDQKLRHRRPKPRAATRAVADGAGLPRMRGDELDLLIDATRERLGRRKWNKLYPFPEARARELARTLELSKGK